MLLILIYSYIILFYYNLSKQNVNIYCLLLYKLKLISINKDIIINVIITYSNSSNICLIVFVSKREIIV